MRRLILLRHAKTEHDAASGEDRDRCLDERGREDAALIGRYIVGQDLTPAVVLVSTATRTRQTWAIIEAAIPSQGPRPGVEFIDALYGAGPSSLLRAIRGAGGTGALMVIGHNPGLHELALALCGHGKPQPAGLSDNLPTSGVAVIDFQIDDWSNVAFGAGVLTRFVTPKLLKEASG